MTKRLEDAIEKVHALPDDRQDEAATLLMSLVEQVPDMEQLDETQIAEIERRLAETKPQYALHEVVKAKFGIQADPRGFV